MDSLLRGCLGTEKNFLATAFLRLMNKGPVFIISISRALSISATCIIKSGFERNNKRNAELSLLGTDINLAVF